MTTATARKNNSEQEGLVPVRCRGCGRQFGLGTGPPGVRVYCSLECAYAGPLGENERRNHLIRSLVACGWTTAKVADRFGISRQRVNQMLYGK